MTTVPHDFNQRGDYALCGDCHRPESSPAHKGPTIPAWLSVGRRVDHVDLAWSAEVTRADERGVELLTSGFGIACRWSLADALKYLKAAEPPKAAEPTHPADIVGAFSADRRAVIEEMATDIATAARLGLSAGEMHTKAVELAEAIWGVVMVEANNRGA